MLSIFHILPCLLLSVSGPLPAGQTDTLAAAVVSSVQLLPVVKPAEEVSLPDWKAAPAQMADILRRFTGVQVKDYGGVGGLKTVNVRSLGSEHVGIFLDGIQIENAQNMQVDLGRLSTLGGIGRITLYNGQKTRRLQTAKEYASGAAVYLDSVEPTLPDGSGGEVRIRGGAFGTFNPSLQWNRRWDRVLLQVSAEGLASNGRYKYPCFDTTLVRENGDIRSARLETVLSGRLRKGEWKVRLYGYGSERGFPGPVIRRAAGFPFSAERQADRDLFVQGGWNQEWTGRYATALRFKLADNYIHYDTHPEKNPMALPYNLHYRQRSAYLSLAQSLAVSGPWLVDLSTDWQRNALDSDVGQFVTPRRSVFTGVLATRLSWERLRLAGHLAWLGAWDRYDSPSAGGWSRENAFRRAWMPSVSLYYAPFQWLEADVFVKRSFRMPSFNDLYYSLMGNAALVPESALQAGADFHFRFPGRTWSWEGRVSPYRNRVDEKIVAIPTASQFRWTMLNIGRVDVAGVDVKSDLELRRGDWKAGALFRYSYQNAVDHSAPGSQTWGNQIPYIPLHSGSADLSVAWKTWTLAWDWVYTGGRGSRMAHTPDYYVAPWLLCDLSLHKKTLMPTHSGHRVKTPELDVGITCYNLLDQSYQVVQGYPMPGIHLMLSVSYAW